MNVEFNTENRNTIRIRCCSFCRRAGHNITRCNSEPIRIFEREIFIYIQITINQIQSRVENLRRYILNKAINYPNLIRAFAISRCRANNRTNMANCISLIIEYFIPFIQEPQESEVTGSEDILEALIEEAVLVLRRTTRFEFLEIVFQNYQAEMSGTIESESLLFSMILNDMIRTIQQEHVISNRKFRIKTKISEKQEDLEEKYECNICYDEFERKHFIKLDCGHELCKDCIKKSLQNEKRLTPCCPFCRADIKNLELKQESIQNEFYELIT
jgi:hypothetical protein